MDGTSGALYAIYLNSLTHALRERVSSGVASPAVWGQALEAASVSFGKYTPAQPGDRTLVDALQPFVETLNSTGDLTKAAEASRKGADSTKGMKASLGRSVYIGGSGFEQVPDPGGEFPIPLFRNILGGLRLGFLLRHIFRNGNTDFDTAWGLSEFFLGLAGVKSEVKVAEPDYEMV